MGGTIAALLPLIIKLNVTFATIILSGIYYGVVSGGTITSVLMNIPGEVCTVVTCIDGYQMAKEGRDGTALGIAAFVSFIASTIGVMGIRIVAPSLPSIALSFAPSNIHR